MRHLFLRLPSHLLLACALVFALGACDSNDPVDDPIDNPDDGDDGEGEDGTYACAVPDLGDVADGQAIVTYDYAVFNSDRDETGEYTGDATYGSTEEFSTLYSVIYLPNGDGSSRNVTLYDDTEAALTPGEYEIDFSGATGFVGYFLATEGGLTTRNGGGGTLDITSVENSIATGTFEFGDSVSAFCGAFKATFDDSLAPEGFDP